MLVDRAHRNSGSNGGLKAGLGLQGPGAAHGGRNSGSNGGLKAGLGLQGPGAAHCGRNTGLQGALRNRPQPVS